MTPDSRQTPVPQRIGALISDARDSMQEFYDAMDEERAFCWDLEQYWYDTGNTRDRNRVQPRDQSPFRLARFKAAEILKAPLYFTARVMDPTVPPAAAKWSRWALQMDIEDPAKRFDRVRDDVVWAGLTSRVGVMKVDWDPDLGAFGDLVWSSCDAKDVGWEQPFTDPHDPRCAWFYQLARMSPESIARQTGWKDTSDVTPDTGPPGASGSTSNTNAAGAVNFTSTSKPAARENKSQKFATVALFWERFGGTRKVVDLRQLEPHERFMAIAAGENAGQRVAMDYGPDPLPEVDITDDGVPLKRIDAIFREQEVLVYPDGKLTICAPWSGDGRKFYEGPWPQPMRTYPYLVWQVYKNPWVQIGTSDVDLNWTMNLVRNATVRRWYEQLRESRGIMLIPGKGLKDANDEDFRYSDANGFVAIYDTAMPPQNIRWVEGPQPSPQLRSFIEYCDASMRSQEGSADIATMGSTEALKGVQVGVMNQAVQSGNTSVDDHIRTFQNEMGLFLSVAHDIQRARWTEKRWVSYLGPAGYQAWMQVRGADLPLSHMIISAKPSLDAINAQQLDGVLKLSQLAAQNPKAAEVAARHMDVDPEDLADILSSAVPPMPPPGPPGVGPPGAPPGPPPPGLPPRGGPPVRMPEPLAGLVPQGAA